MTVSTTDSVIEYVSGGPAFPIPYRFLQDSDIEAVLVKQDGTSETLTGAQYTLSGAGSQNGGTLTSAYAASVLATPGAVLTISRVMDAVQPTDLRNQGKFLAETHETVFDRLTMLIQQGFSILRRALLRPIGKAYYDAEARQIKNLGDPTENQDATTKKWVTYLISSILATGQGPINNAANVIFTGANGVIGVVQDLATSTGSAFVGFIQAGVGAVFRTLQSKSRERVSILDFGVVGDGVADDTAALQAAFNYCASNWDTLSPFLHGAPVTCRVTAPLVFTGDGDLSMLLIIADSASVNPVFRYGSTSGLPVSHREFKAPSLRNSTKPADGWAGANVGLELANCNSCDITITSVVGFSTGVMAGGYNSGFAYNDVHVRYLVGNRINLHVIPLGDNGWSNENNWFGGRYGHNTTDTTDWSGTRNIKLSCTPTTVSGPPNNNLFVRPSVESASVEFMLDIQGQYNTFLNGRYEGAAKRVRFYSETPGQTTSNLIIGGYQAATIQYTFSGASSTYNSSLLGRTNALEGSGHVLNIVNASGNDISAPHIQGFAAGQQALSKTNSNTDWTYRVHSQGISGKQSADASPRLTMDWSAGRMYVGSGTATPTSYVGLLGTSIAIGENCIPSVDNTKSLGIASFRWTTAYLATAPVVGSDERIKQQIQNIPESVLNAWAKVGYQQYKFNDAVELKGPDDARWHFGVIAQRVKEAFESEGLDPFAYGVLCHDIWEETPEILDDEGNVIEPARQAGEMFAIRYEYAMVLESALMRRETARLGARLAALEGLPN